ncbi:DUF262 domain-containing protein [Pseudomonas putida]|uniref:DUF262 domain-containing protein n=1 Tax=Pseudomonas putida TaxID=303 RepID=UPI0039E07B86
MAEKPFSMQEEDKNFSEEILGFEFEEDVVQPISEPFDPSKIKVQTEKKTIDLIFRRWVHEEIDLAPEFQRRARLWPAFRRSQLIESLLLKIPLPVFYVAADQEDRWAVVDGLQRITTIIDFLSNEFPLEGLEYLSHLEGQYYSSLDRAMKRRIEETELVINIIQPGTPDEVMMNIFKRINTGGIALNGQEIRNAINKGVARSFLNYLATSIEFQRATDFSVSDKRMDAQELVLRFVAFSALNVNERQRNLENLLNESMKQLNIMENRQLDVIAMDFKKSMALAFELFGADAFRKPSSNNKRNPINKSLFDSWSVVLSTLHEREALALTNNKALLLNNYYNTYASDSKFVESITTSTGHHPRIMKRFLTILTIVRETIQGNQI